MSEVKVTAFRDREADVWVAESDDVRGLITKSDTLEEVVSKLRLLIPESLMDAGKNGHSDDVPFTLEVKDVAHALEA
jgi:predicted RNase H-like HicB family nuclease